jgi:glycosyltransferase involved in cell wall biosynthesis
MNVVVFKECLDPHSGFSKHILEVSRRLSERYGYRFRVITTRVLDRVQDRPGMEILTVKGHPYSYRYTRSAHSKIQGLLEEFQPELVDHHGGPGAFLLAGRVPSPWPSVFSMHAGKYSLRDYLHVRGRDLWPERSQLWGPGYLLNALLPLKLLGALLKARGPRALAVPSRALQKALSAQLDFPVFYIPSGVDPERFGPRPCAKGALGFGEDERLVLFYGKSQLLRGIDLLLEAFTMVSRAAQDVSLLLVLRPDRATERVLRLVARHPVRERISAEVGTFPDVRGFLAAADLVALPFRSPTALPAQPLTLLEAMASAKPIISTRLAPICEIVADGREGLLVPPNRPDLLADRIIRVLEDPQLAERLGKYAREKILSEYDWDRIAERTHAFYQAALKLSQVG